MLPDVAAEAAEKVRKDPILKCVGSPVPGLAVPILERWCGETPSVRPADIGQLEAYARTLRQTYVLDAVSALKRFAIEQPQHLFALEGVWSALISDLRFRGWSDEALRELVAELSDIEPGACIDRLELVAQRRPLQFTCIVPVRLWRLEKLLQNVDGFTVLGKPRAEVDQRVAQNGPYLQLVVEAFDPQTAAEMAFSRVTGVLGALAVFEPRNVEVRSRMVGVLKRDRYTAYDVAPSLPVESRRPNPSEVRRIVASAQKSVAVEHDAVFDAIGYRARALQTDDPESRFMLLWFGLERMVLGAPGYGRALAAARELVSKAITLGKLRTEIAALASAIADLDLPDAEWQAAFPLIGWKKPAARRVDRNKLLQVLQGPVEQSRKLTAFFYERDVRLVQWYERLRKQMSGAKPDKIAAYFEDSRQRVEWQVLRLYRARNSVAHAGHGPSWLNDLTLHANYYLVELIAIAVHYRQRSPTRQPGDILASRAAAYDAFVSLIRKGDRRATGPDYLLRPTRLVGGA